MIRDECTWAVTIGGVSVPNGGVTALSVSRQRQQRVGEVSFTQHKVVCGDAAYAAATRGAAVSVTLTVGATSITTTAEIQVLTEREVGGQLRKEVRAHTLERSFQDVRLKELWVDELAGSAVNDIIAETTALTGITAGSIADAGRKIGEISARYDSAYELMENICSQTGLAWEVVGTELNLYVPEDRSSPDITDPEWVDGTAPLTTSLEGVYNVARMLAYEYEYIEFIGQPCDSFYDMPIAGPGWELSGEIGESEHWFPDDFNVDTEALQVTWSPYGYPFYSYFYVRRPIWVTRSDTDSIASYGHREAAPLPNNGGISTASARAMLDFFLMQKAEPFGSVSGIQPAIFGHTVDSACNLEIDSLSINQQVYITGTRHDIFDKSLVVTLDAVTRAGLGRDHDPAIEMMRRLERLERSGLHPSVAQGPPTSHPIISYPGEQLAVKNGDTISIAGEGTPNMVLEETTVRDINNGTVPASDVGLASYSADDGLFSGTFEMGTNSTPIVRLEMVLANAAGSSFLEQSRSNPLDVNNTAPSDTSILIDLGNPTTTSRNVQLTLSATGAHQMYIDGDVDDDYDMRTWQSYASPRPAVLTEGLGVKSITVVYRNTAHIEAASTGSSIELVSA